MTSTPDSSRVAAILAYLQTLDPSHIEGLGPFTPEERAWALQMLGATMELEVEQSKDREPLWEIFVSHMSAGRRTFSEIFEALSDEERAIVEAYLEAGHEPFWLKVPDDHQGGTS